MPSSIAFSTTAEPLAGVGSSALSASVSGLGCGGAGAVDGGRPRVPEARRAAGHESGSGRLDNGHGSGPTTAAEGGGLVICAKNVRTPADEVSGAREWRAVDALGMRFPSPEMVQSAAALFDKAVPWAADRDRLGTEPESGRFRITVGPGVIRLGWTNPVRAEKASQRALARHELDVADWQHRVNDLFAKASRLDPRAVVTVSRRSLTDVAPGRTGRVITNWSRKSRSAMCRTFAELDYTPLIESGRVPAMVTLTYPGDWETVAPDGASVKRHMVLWRKRFHREYGEPARYIWKLEFQRRGAPHIHLWMAPPLSPGKSNLPFATWLSETWADIVDHPDDEQKTRHRLAGTAIDILSGLRACDPKRLAIYFTKHSSPNSHGDKEYQHIVPESWQQPGKGPGRFWGVYGLRKATAVAEIAHDTYLTARRIIRRWSRNQATYADHSSRFPTAVVPRTAHRIVQRVDRSTGEISYRRVRRRRPLCHQGGLNGGYALVNDGPSFAAQLARAIR
ncbi:rolling circle replication-associated protein [Mycobacteroides abscessus]|uniref:rolling circle replication-associated protein n=1 Tax=Mycobacteroides abscessus TaxID=36809 RepID=UPI000C25BA3F